MFVHMEDQGELNILLGDNGVLIAVCPNCKKIWTGQLALTQFELTGKESGPVGKTKGRISPALRSFRLATSVLGNAAQNNPLLLENLGMDTKTIGHLADLNIKV
ncbi:MAG: hypothetical protein AB1531_05740 [Chloroflexota bacterium]